MYTSVFLMIASLGLAQADSLDASDTGESAEDPCRKWGKIVPLDGTIGQVGSDSLWFEVGGQDCPGVEPDNCEWYLDPNDGSRGQLPGDNTGGQMQWLPPGGVDSCPPILATLIVECVDLDGDILTNSVDLTVDDSNNRCDLMGGGCISPSSQAGGVFFMVPLLWLVGRRESK